MKRNLVSFLFAALCLFISGHPAQAQNTDIKFISDTLIVQAEGTYQADPDLATLLFDISVQDKELKTTYGRASESMKKIVSLAEQNGLRKEDISSGVLTVRPYYDDAKKRKAKYYQVQGQVTLRVRDFTKLGPILEGSVEEGITDFRSLTYSLADEEAAKQRAVAEAMRRAIGRASAALEQKGQKVGTLRFANLDVKQLVGVSRIDAYQVMQLTEATSGGGGGSGKRMPAPPPPPIPQPEKITVSATVQCAFQIQ
ncbi:MAG: SIMPL domain-containing protein [Terriglobia bacterium]